ncbi:hypothetical protein COLO4_11878 [Corchorus olitorius]|uniref:Uncharacterized protein n=1 Tax=Corchorus olitorius TaxID=93759 RepID=A0A1R3K2Z6_9ROSI|nr:hypothetical protein COLO4_11878 [Corchorus olitorius]
MANHSNPKVVIIGRDGDSDRKNNLHIDNGGMIMISAQLEILALSNCNLKSIPKFLNSQQQLKAVDFSHNKLMGNFPTWLLESNAQLEFLNLENNYFAGPIHPPPYLMRNVVWLDISSNHFDGELPSSINGLKILEVLDLSFNNFRGDLSKKLTVEFTNLNHLKLSNNSGQICSAEFNLSNLGYLKLNNNHFIGSLTNVNFKLLEGLMVFDVSNNNMTGEIPSSFANLYSSLWILNLKNNNFEGHFPCGQDFEWLVYLDLSHNLFSGP